MKSNSAFFLLIVSLVCCTSCKEEIEEETYESKDYLQEIVEEVHAMERIIEDRAEEEEVPMAVWDTEIPDFDHPEAKKYIKDYEAYISEYKETFEKKNEKAFWQIQMKGQELVYKSQYIADLLSIEDIRKLNSYLLWRSSTLEEISNNMM
ncbi:hypothetical protein ACFSTE_21365 [Aquimarina hainanensis]|uniref:Uncharacterized protein n=1 Tax=Aquimarina hainanensis TaxID=1578017 RepID=A0ABW5NG65_9FLAO|nr:hypothetical protein [Aquimarina sp. TRL1]QKX07260.1 hypothetical protein HN014_20880 [Aquimarina sp. TRL1]